MRDYNGKTVYVGIDVHKKTYSCVSICNNEAVKRDSMPGKPEVVLNYLNNAFKGAKIESVYEAGFSGFHLHRFLVSNVSGNLWLDHNLKRIDEFAKQLIDHQKTVLIATPNKIPGLEKSDYNDVLIKQGASAVKKSVADAVFYDPERGVINKAEAVKNPQARDYEVAN